MTPVSGGHLFRPWSYLCRRPASGSAGLAFGRRTLACQRALLALDKVSSQLMDGDGPSAAASSEMGSWCHGGWGGQCRSISCTTGYRGAKAPPGQLRPDIAAGMPRWPEGQGSRPAGLRCTQRLRADRSRSCAAARTKVRGWHQEHPQSPWAPVLPHTFKRRRKFENSQPPSSFLLLSRLPPRLTHLGCSLLPSPPSSSSPQRDTPWRIDPSPPHRTPS